MDIPLQFELVKQPERSKLCGIAVCAMATGKTLQQVWDEVGDWRKLTSIVGVATYLIQHGITMGFFVRDLPSGNLLQRLKVDLRPDGHPAILMVKSASIRDGSHWVFWDGKQILDPSHRTQNSYEIMEAHFLTYHSGEPCNLDRIPADYMLQDSEIIALEEAAA